MVFAILLESARFGEAYNNVCLNSATGYMTPADMLAGRQQEIHAEREREVGGKPALFTWERERDWDE